MALVMYVNERQKVKRLAKRTIRLMRINCSGVDAHGGKSTLSIDRSSSFIPNL